jgi:hypothetical protein
MKISNKESFLIFFPVALGVFCIALAFWLLPENCSLFISNVPDPQMCHTIPLPPDCYDSFCKDTQTEFISSIIAGLGIGLFFVPVIVFWLITKKS